MNEKNFELGIHKIIPIANRLIDEDNALIPFKELGRRTDNAKKIEQKKFTISLILL